jgi:hypothetical protein
VKVGEWDEELLRGKTDLPLFTEGGGAPEIRKMVKENVAGIEAKVV